jgi:transcriptional regulator
MTEPQLADLLNRPVQYFQPSEKVSPVEVGRSFFGRALGAIVGIRIAIGHVEAKFKFGGNRTLQHRLAIAQKLAERGERGDCAALSHLLRRTKLEETP